MNRKRVCSPTWNTRLTRTKGSNNPAVRRTWASSIRSHFENRGYTSRLYFRHATGGPMFAGDVHPAIAGASDLLICPREVISFTEPPKHWRPEIDSVTVVTDVVNRTEA